MLGIAEKAQKDVKMKKAKKSLDMESKASYLTGSKVELSR
jgi:hypothetical protein